MMTSPDDNPSGPQDAQAGAVGSARPPGKVRRASHRALVLVLLAACAIMGALLAHQRLLAPGPHAPVASPPAGLSPWPTPTSEPAVSGNAGEMIRQPLAGANLELLNDDPPEAVPPPEGARLSGFQRILPDGVSDIISYVSSSSVEPLAAFYRTSVPPKGFKLVREGPTMTGDGRSLLFLQDRRQYVVNLHSAEKGTKVRVVLIIARSAQRAQPP